MIFCDKCGIDMDRCDCPGNSASAHLFKLPKARCVCFDNDHGCIPAAVVNYPLPDTVVHQSLIDLLLKAIPLK